MRIQTATATISLFLGASYLPLVDSCPATEVVSLPVVITTKTLSTSTFTGAPTPTEGSKGNDGAGGNNGGNNGGGRGHGENGGDGDGVTNAQGTGSGSGSSSSSSGNTSGSSSGSNNSGGSAGKTEPQSSKSSSEPSSPSTPASSGVPVTADAAIRYQPLVVYCVPLAVAVATVVFTF